MATEALQREAPGLDEGQAVRRLAAEGPNEMPEPEAPGLVRTLAREAAEPLAAVLGVAGLVTIALLGEVPEGIAILAIVALNVAVSTWQQLRSERAVRSLGRLAAPEARVRRGGVVRTVPARELVRGDLVLLAAGDRVPADVRLLEAHRLAADEALLTGEPFPASKRAGGPAAPHVAVADRAGMAFAGTMVVRGRGEGEVAATGARTAMGAIAAGLKPSPPPPLEGELRRATWRIAAVAVAAGLALAAAAWVRSGGAWAGVVQAVLAGVALAVAAIPEGLLAVVTTSLALGALRMARRGAIVRNLRAIEGLGAASVLCVDKTGTLTEGRLALAGAEVAPGREGAFWDAALRCNDAQHGEGDPVDVALASGAAARAHPMPRGPRAAERPFDPAARLMATVHIAPAGPVLSVKGAPEVVLARCVPGPDRDALEARAEALARRGLRVLALADLGTRDLDAHGMRPLGLATFEDPLRPTARDAMAACRAAGVRVVMVTGDHAATARAVADEVGLGGEGAVTGAQLAAMPVEERRAALAAATVVARVEPAVKVNLIQAHRGAGRVVAMTGDGVNDAPALRQADIGVAVAGEGGSDVAREAADLVVTDNDLGTLVAAAREGRRIERNLRSVVGYLLTGNASEVVVILAGLALLPELAVPLLPVQILWLNLVTDGIPALALGVDVPPGDPLATPPRRRGEELLTLRRQGGLVARGALAAAVVLGTALAVRGWGWPVEMVQAQLLLSLVVVHLSLAYVFRADRVTFGRGWWRNPLLLAAVVGSGLVQLAAFYGPGVREALGLVPLPAVSWLLALGAAAGVVAAIDLARGARRAYPASQPPST